jgi:hypothetical protein
VVKARCNAARRKQPHFAEKALLRMGLEWHRPPAHDRAHAFNAPVSNDSG